MSGWYQQARRGRAGNRRGHFSACIGWFALSPVLMWFPGSEGAGWAWLGPVGTAFHALWFCLGAWLLRPKGSKLRQAATWFGLVVLGAVFELGQAWIPGRDPSWVDGALNALGAAVGLWFARPRSG